MAMPGLRQAVNDHRRLRRRLEALPWERNTALGAEVLERMQRPEALLDLAHDLPDLARQLASSPPDPEAPTWRSWRPTSSPTPSQASVEVAPIPEPVETLEAPTPAEHQPLRSEPVAHVTSPSARPEAVEEEEDTEALEEQVPVVEDHAEERAREERVLVKQRHSTSSMTEGQEDLRPTLNALITDLGLDAPEALDAGSVRRTLGPHVQQQPKDIRVTRLLRLILRLLPEALDEATVGQKELVARLAGMVDTLNAWTSLRLQARHLPNGHGLLEDALVLGEALHRIPGPGRRLPLGEDTHALPSPGAEEDLRGEVLRLSQSVNLPSAGGIR